MNHFTYSLQPLWFNALKLLTPHTIYQHAGLPLPVQDMKDFYQQKL